MELQVIHFLLMSVEDNSFFISSSKFNVKAGQITGSNVSFIGGKIGGWTIGPDGH